MILINSNEELNELIIELQKELIIGLDVEGSSLDPYTATLLLVQISTDDNTYVINVGRVEKKTLRYLFQLVKERNILCVGHNFKYDMKMIYHNLGVLLTHVFDTMLAEAFQKPGIAKPFNSFKAVALKYIGVTLNKQARESFIGKTDFEFTDEEIEYAAEDVEYLLPIMRLQRELLAKNQSVDVWELEMELLPVVGLMEYQGVLLDIPVWRGLGEKSERLAQEYSVKITAYLADKFNFLANNPSNAFEACETMCIPVKTKKERLFLTAIVTGEEIMATVVPMINMNSYKQALHILHKLDIPTTSSSQKELQKYKGHEFIDLLFKYREHFKASHAFGVEFIKAVNPISGRLHGSFEQSGTTTGRFSSNNPNLQNIKVAYRRCFLAQPGYKFFTADYSQIELRILAEISKEPLMMEAFINGEDLHKLTASIIFDKSISSVSATERGRAKNVNFAVVYGTTAYGLRYHFGWSLEQGKEYLDRYFARYTTLRDFIDLVSGEVLRRGYSTTKYGRLRYFTVPYKTTRRDIPKLRKIQRQGVNHIIQGSSADMIKLNLCNLFYKNPFDSDVEFPENFRVLQTVHDECDGEFKEDLEGEAKEFIGTCMEDAAKPFLKEVPVAYNIEVDNFWRK